MPPFATLSNVVYSYPEREVPSLRDISLELGPAEFVLVLGASGSGKSSLLRLLSGLIPHFHGGRFSGRAVVAGNDIRETAARDLAQHVGFVFQDPENQAVMSSVEREIAFGLENLGTRSAAISRLVEEALISLGLSHLRRASLRTLSGGELQKVALASVLVMQPRLLLLDEPTSQLDPVSSEELLSTLRRLLEDTGGTVVLAEHRAERCLHLATRVIYMQDGAVVQDSSPAEFSRWALERHPEYLPPVARLFGARVAHEDGSAASAFPVEPTGATSEEAAVAAPGVSSLPPAPACVPLTVQEARRALEEGGCIPRSVREQGSRVNGLPVSEPVLRTVGLAVGYEADAPLLEDLDLALHPGEFVALMGENGCGKSTLVRHFNGLLKPLRGRVLLEGSDVGEYSVAAAARRCGLLGQNPNDYFVKDSVREELQHTLDHLGLDPASHEDLLRQTIDEMRLEHLLERDPRSLSGGERSRAALSTVAVGRPPLMVLDEPTRGIDPPSKVHMGRVLAQWADAGRCVLLVTHDVEFAARYARRIVILGDGGIIADGPPGEVLDGALYFSTQVNRLVRHVLPQALTEQDVGLVCA